MANKIGLTILVSIILIILIVSVSNLGASFFLSEPEYNDYCGDVRYEPKSLEENQIFCEANDGVWKNGYCNYYEDCQGEYNKLREVYNQSRFYVFAIIGIILLIGGLYSKDNLIQYTGLASGAILILEGVVINLQNKLVVFISLLLILILFAIFGYRVVNNKK